jgi:hypothetical protein
MLRSRQRGQSVVEFGIVAILFTLLMFAVVDFGLLLNSWVALSSATRQVARDATVGYFKEDLYNATNSLGLPGITRTPYAPFAGYCCGAGGANDEIVLTIAYYDHCIPGGAGCVQVPASQLDSRYWGGGTCASACAHPARGDTIVVSLVAPGMEVVTPLVRPFFGCSSNQQHCNVKLASSAMMRYEGEAPS